MSKMRGARRMITGFVGMTVLIVAVSAAEAREPRGSTTSDGPSSPYTNAQKKNKPSKTTPQPSSNNRFICESNCPYPADSSRQRVCIQQCLDRLSSRGKH